LLSQTAEYALRAVLHIASYGAEHPVPVQDIASALDVPRNYLSKTLHQLSRAGVLVSTFGPGGGFQLAKSPQKLVLDDVVRPFDEAGERHCLLGRTRCLDSNPCQAHGHWKGIAAQIQNFFRTTTVATLLEGGADDLVSLPAPRARRTAGR
jgi:Rrf2 family protein